ncbi:hypothetical protein FLAG1_09684 [Fusarium langsethiae]|uniref:Uncharacterized protein n=1 Tax=Fusarium langsethiae TaxID=179993 RepID=A0A0M9EPZ7_FUSLA|nr:hypothetical protein FLAG1_09684 [Fusarium langsethiae]
MGEATAIPPGKYSPGRAASAARRVYSYCGEWPHELIKGFSPLTWGVKISEEFATLIRLAAESPKIQLSQVIQRLKYLTLRRKGQNGIKCLNRTDVSKARDWLRQKGIDTYPPRLPNENTTTQLTSDEEDGDEDDARRFREGSEVGSVIVARNSDDNNDSSDSSSDGDETILDDAATEDDEIAISEQNKLSTSQTKSNGTTPVGPNTQPISRFFPSKISTASVSEPRSSASQLLGGLNGQPRTTPSPNPAQSSPNRHRVIESVNAHFQESIRRAAMAGRDSWTKPQDVTTADKPPTTPSSSVARPESVVQVEPPVVPSRATPSNQVKPSPSRPAVTEPDVRVETCRHTMSLDRDKVRQTTNSESRHEPSTMKSSPKLNSQVSNGPIPKPKSTPAVAASSSNIPPSPTGRHKSASTTTARFVPVMRDEAESQSVALHTHLDRSSNRCMTAPTHSYKNPSPSAAADKGVPSTPAPSRSDAQSGISSTRSSSTPITTRPRRNIKPPSRHIHDLPLSALANRDISRKRPLESDTPVTSKAPEQPAALSASQTARGTTTVPTDASPSQVALTNNSAPVAVSSTRDVFELNPNLQAIRKTKSMSSIEPPSQIATKNASRANTASLSQPIPTYDTQSCNAIPKQASSSETVENRPAKRHRSNDTKEPSTSSNGILDFDATLPDGDCFKAHLREWRSWVEPYATAINKQHEEILNDFRMVNKVSQTNKANKEATLDKIQVAQKSMDDNQEKIATTLRIIRALGPEVEKDESARKYLEERQEKLAEQETLRRSFKTEIAQAQALLLDFDSKHAIIDKRLRELARDELKVKKNKEALNSAMKKWRIQTQIMEGEGGWAKALKQFGAEVEAGRFNGL